MPSLEWPNRPRGKVNAKRGSTTVATSRSKRRLASFDPLRRRLDHLALRWHARLDSPFADRSLPWMLAGGLFVVLGALALARVRSLEPSESLARYTQAAWQLHRDRSTALTLLPAGIAGPQPLSALDGSLLFYPLGWLVGFLPIKETLVIMQAAALSFTVLPMWRLARRVARLRVGATSALVGAYALYPPLHLMNTAGFDPRVLAVPVLMSMVYRALHGSRVHFALSAAVVLTISAHFALVLVGFGVMLAVTVRRKAGIALAGAGLLAAIGEQTVAALGAGDRAFVDGESFAPGVRSALGVLGHAIAHPVASLGHLGEHRVLAIMAALLLPAALLPLLSMRHLAPVLPLQLVYLLGSVPASLLLGPLAAAATVFVFTASTFALSRLGRHGGERVAVPPRLSGALIGAAVLFFLLDASTSPYQQPWLWGGRDRYDEVRLRWVEQIIADGDAESTVAATADMTPMLADHVPLCGLPLDAASCPATPDVFLVDVELDPAALTIDGLRIVESDADGRFVMLRRSS